MKKALGMKYCSPENMSISSNSCLAPSSPKSFILRLGKQYNLPEDIIQKAMEIYEKYEKERNDSSAPQIVAGACLLISMRILGLEMTRRELADLVVYC